METSQDHMDTDIGRSGSKEGKGEKTEGIQFESDGKPVKRRDTDDDPPPYYPVYQEANPDAPQNQEKYDPKPAPLNREKYIPKPVPLNQFNDKETMASKISECGFISLIIFCIITLIVSIITYWSIGSYDGAIVDFKHNWNLRPITDIKTALHECPSGYEDLISSEWPGTSEGCDCTYSSKHYSTRLKSNMCSQNQTIAGCRTISATKSIPINKFYSYRICGKRSGDAFINLQKPIREFGGDKIECGYGYKLCGTGGRDYSVCVRDSQECPLNHIYIEILSDLSQIPEGYKAQPLDGGQYVLFTNRSDRLPTVQLKLAEGNICADPNKGDFTSGRSHYKLLRYQSRNGCTSKIAGSYFDPRYRMIGTIREDRL